MLTVIKYYFKVVRRLQKSYKRILWQFSVRVIKTDKEMQRVHIYALTAKVFCRRQREFVSEIGTWRFFGFCVRPFMDQRSRRRSFSSLAELQAPARAHSFLSPAQQLTVLIRSLNSFFYDSPENMTCAKNRIKWMPTFNACYAIGHLMFLALTFHDCHGAALNSLSQLT